ncbi:helix-turn-helix transcriptional regulator [Roseicyclus mahoneyensis]|uniref:helix-turn-helix transcriptional regulator n=1 Tax=Roseicyclus mahoneyensis TaxID=164332 RepID=UPI000D6B7282|nr:LuxR family transcriptional regulator [Roseicyclus mahoneyensis]
MANWSVDAVDETLIEKIYEAAFIPERWNDVLQKLADVSGGVSAAVIVYNGLIQPRWRSTPLIDEVLTGYCTSDAWKVSELTPYMLNVPPAAFFYDADYFPGEVLSRDLMRAPLKALGIGNQLGTLMRMPTGENVCITIELSVNSTRPGNQLMDGLAGLRPHLARTGLMAARLGLERAQAAVSVLASMGLPAAVLAQNGRVLAANTLLESANGSVIFTAMGKLALRHRAANMLFQEGLSQAARNTVVRSIPVRSDGGNAPCIVHILPITGAAHDIFDNAATAVVITPVNGANAPDTVMLHGLFDLTPAEARLAQHLVEGRSTGGAADALGVSITTIRSQLSAIFSKTGTKRQSELTSLLSSLGSIKGGEGSKPRSG